MEALPAEVEAAACKVAASLYRRGGPEELDDLKQEARLIAWQAVAEAQHARNLAAYAAQRVSWRLRTRLRKERRAVPSSSDLRFVLAVEEQTDDVDVFDEVVGRLDSAGVLVWLDLLTPTQRRVLVLYDIAEFPMVEVARRLGLTVGAAKQQRHRAVAALRALAERAAA